MKKKTLAEYEKQREKANEYQKRYRRENAESVNIWRLRSAANFLRKNGWTVTPPPDFPTLEQVKTKREIMRALNGPPVDLSDFDEIMKAIKPEDLPFE